MFNLKKVVLVFTFGMCANLCFQQSAIASSDASIYGNEAQAKAVCTAIFANDPKQKDPEKKNKCEAIVKNAKQEQENFASLFKIGVSVQSTKKPSAPLTAPPYNATPYYQPDSRMDILKKTPYEKLTTKTPQGYTAVPHSQTPMQQATPGESPSPQPTSQLPQQQPQPQKRQNIYR